ncbi:MAG: class I SAM-dependent methyltransferase [Nanoarchaeota archaeon]
MDTKEYETSFKIEESYWWFVGQQFLVREFLKKYYSGQKNLQQLDIGCGTGITLQILQDFGKAQGMDLSDDAIDFCKKRGFSITKGDVAKMPFADDSFDVITCLGVFYHKGVKDDSTAMKEIKRVLKPGGRLLFMDCAMPSLYGKHDMAFHGIRRYTKKDLAAKMQQAGLSIERMQYYNFTLFLPVYFKRKFEKLSKSHPKSEVSAEINPLFNGVLKKMYLAELRLLKYISYPVGINILAVGKKEK